MGKVLRMGNVVMFHAGRSGSVVLADLLQRHPMVEWDGELFRPNRVSGHVGQWDGKADPMRFLRQQIDRVEFGWYGWEFKFFHARRMRMDLAAVLDGFVDAGVTRSIILTRENHLRKVVSGHVARKTSRWHVKDDRKVRLTPVKLDIENLTARGMTMSLIAHFEYYEENFRLLDDHLKGRQVLRVSYEEDLECDPQVGYRQICEFLDIPYLWYPVRLVRTTPFKLSEVLINYDEVVRALENTRFAWMLRD